jgi:Tol biopolymer transport system component
MQRLAGGPIVLLALCLAAPETTSAGIVTPAGSAGREAAPARTELISVALPGKTPNGRSTGPDLSFDGRYVAFVSWATNLVQGDTNRFADIFVRDRRRGMTERVSVAGDGAQANGGSDRPRVSADGRFVAFRSHASNLVPGDTNRLSDVFVRDVVLGETYRVSVATSGRQGNAPITSVAISGNGRFVAFSSRASTLDRSDQSRLMKIFVHDRTRGTTRVLRLVRGGANGDSHASSISWDGRVVAFRSYASNLVRDDTNAVSDAFLVDRRIGRTVRLSVSSFGVQADLHSFRPMISSTGRVAVFRSFASNLVPGDTNGQIDVFVRDLRRGVTSRVSTGQNGEEANDRPLIAPSISGNGRLIVFGSLASNLVAGDTNGAADIFLHDMRLHTTRRVSLALADRQANGASHHARISSNGRAVAFSSDATNLASGDHNRLSDIYVRRLRA